MAGAAVPLIMIPRFSTYSGEGSFTSAPLDVSGYSKAVLQFWRGPLVGTVSGATPSFAAVFQQSQVGYDDPGSWVDVGSVITSVNTVSTVELDLDRRWFRVKIDLVASLADLGVGITCWAIGSLVQRVE